MALSTRKAFLEVFNPFLQAKRFKGKINIQKPKPPHFQRARYIELSKPYFISPNAGKSMIELCSKGVEEIRQDVVDNPYQRILAAEVNHLYHNSKLIAFYHLNSISADDRFKAYAMFKKENMLFKSFGKKVTESALIGSKFEPILDFYVSRNITVFSKEAELKKLLKITKRFPDLILLAAIFEGKLINKDQIMEMSLIPDIQTAQAGLVQTLNSAAVTLTTQLNSHQNALVSHLQERIKQLE